jgi:hypothetical protein
MKPQPRFGLAEVFSCSLFAAFALAWSTASLAQKTDVLTTTADRYVKECAVHLAVPADWSIAAEISAKGCDIDAIGPDDPDLCSEAGDPEEGGVPAYCDEEKRIRIEIHTGTIDEMAKSLQVDDDTNYEARSQAGDFRYEDGTWVVDSLARRETIRLAGKGRTIVYGPWLWRKEFQDGSYCCTIGKWEAMVELPRHRWAWIFVNWDEDEKNVVRFLQSIK